MSKLKTGMGTKVELDGFEISSVSSIEIEIEPRGAIYACVKIPIESVEIVDGKQLIKLTGELTKVD